MATKSYSTDQRVQSHRWWILAAVGLFTFMSTLDASIVNIALPVISGDLKIPMNQAEWVVSIYLIVICSLLLLFGKLGDSVGKIKVFRIGTGLFVFGSLLAGFNGSFYLLLSARVVQALGASMTMANNNGIITEVFPFSERGRALGMIGSFVALGSIAGPGLGGIVLSHLSWGYIFWLNVPVGVVTIIIGHAILPKDITKSHEKIDRLGAVTMALFMVSLFVGIFLGQEIGFSNPVILGLFAFAMIIGAVFVRIENHSAKPLLAFSLFENGAFTMSLLCGFLIFVTNFFFNVISPFYLENARGLRPNIAGLILMAFPIVQVIVAPMAGALSDRIGPELITFCGLILILLSQIGYMLTDLGTPLWLFTAIVGCVGLGNGIFQAPNNTIVMNSVAPQDLGIAGGMNALVRNLGMVVGISFATTVLFAGMSHDKGTKVTTYLKGQPDVFIYGMHIVFLIAAVICAIAALITGYRLIKRPTKPVKDEF
ncbi:major facilitator superfamily transporter [Secundilactobacillus pentosiphilus]|uniref:Major facilitator superfamily transporter n=1 Tax=Secundilactobacillus pentosiphilus TaxID=1714682 RepID=A0A1Z5ISQ3_9LACO|nr:MFS transporter [Secundilactobacillus pentosiphilus]GAX04797.1 major facilitator superfamily transporter [Secundilactobacillus pentosiphilus]